MCAFLRVLLAEMVLMDLPARMAFLDLMVVLDCLVILEKL